LGKHAWFKKNAAKTTHAVGEKRPNPWGLFDMHGNVAEWCNDFYSEAYQPEADATDPRGPTSGKERVLRGGSWASSDAACRSSARASETPGFADVCFGYETYGFRCIRRADKETP
jgi:formylglycine-generating enzyme required for sulfatase activity